MTEDAKNTAWSIRCDKRDGGYCSDPQCVRSGCKLEDSHAKEPAAWQWRYVGATEWSTPSGGKRLDAETLKRERPIEQRPLYASVHPKYILAPAQCGVINPLKWNDVYSHREDGGTDLIGWEADTGFGVYYGIDEYWASDSHGWELCLDYEKLGDFDDPDQAKAFAQKHYAERISSAILTPAACEQPDIDALAQFIRDAEREHGQCDDDDTYISYRPTARAILQKFDVRPKHTSTMREGGQ